MSCALGQQLYCPQHAAYIDVGMSAAEVISACGAPLAKQETDAPVMQQVPSQQLIYTTINAGSVYPGLDSAFYNQWSLPSGTSGVGLEINIINGKVNAVLIGGTNTNALSICHGISVQVGDSVAKIYSACGQPTMVNNSYVNEPIPSDKSPELWIYQFDQYQAPISLTFVNDTLQSIN